MTTAIQSVARVPFVDSSGILTRDGVKFLTQILTRLGGVDGMSSPELLAAIQTAQAAEMVVQVAPGDHEFADIVQTAQAQELGETVTQPH